MRLMESIFQIRNRSRISKFPVFLGSDALNEDCYRICVLMDFFHGMVTFKDQNSPFSRNLLQPIAKKIK